MDKQTNRQIVEIHFCFSVIPSVANMYRMFVYYYLADFVYGSKLLRELKKLDKYKY